MRNVIRYHLILLCGLLGLSSNLAIADIGIISGRVIDASSLASIASANINTKPYGQSTTTDINGDYTMGDLPNGDYLVMVSATGYIPISKLITLAEGKSGILNFELVPISSPTPSPSISSTPVVTPCGDISTDEATDVTSNSATLNATVCVGITAGQIYFEYGTTSGTYTSSIDARRDDLSNSVYARISGLSPATIYYYRIVVVQKGTPPNSEKFTYGEEKFFTTLSDTITPTPECEAKKMLVSPRNLRLKRGQSSEVTVTLDGDNCVPTGKTIKATIGKFGSTLISISSKSGITDENGKATFTITAKENIGSTKVKFKVGSQKRAIIVRVRG